MNPLARAEAILPAPRKPMLSLADMRGIVGVQKTRVERENRELPAPKESSRSIDRRNHETVSSHSFGFILQKNRRPLRNGTVTTPLCHSEKRMNSPLRSVALVQYRLPRGRDV